MSVLQGEKRKVALCRLRPAFLCDKVNLLTLEMSQDVSVS